MMMKLFDFKAKKKSLVSLSVQLRVVSHLGIERKLQKESTLLLTVRYNLWY